MTDLMAPRIKVIALWPFCRQHNNLADLPKIGDIFFVAPDQSISNSAMTIMRVDKYPHLFQKLQWWMEREDHLIPSYLKDTGDGEIFQVYSVEKGRVLVANKTKAKGWTSLEHFLPATAADYDNYLKAVTP